MKDAPDQSYRTLRQFLPKSLQPTLRGVRKRLFSNERPSDDPYHSVFPFTQVHIDRQRNLVRLARSIEEQFIPGDIVECGVLDGGTAALMASTARRRIHLFDSWQGLPAASEVEGDGAIWSGECVGSSRRVGSIMRKLSVPEDRVVFHRGWFADTFPNARIEKISLLHIDADYYDSVKISLDTWFPRLSKGGFVQFDDYSIFVGCTRAVDEFLAANPRQELRQDGVVFYLQKNE